MISYFSQVVQVICYTSGGKKCFYKRFLMDTWWNPIQTDLSLKLHRTDHISILWHKNIKCISSWYMQPFTWKTNHLRVIGEKVTQAQAFTRTLAYVYECAWLVYVPVTECVCICMSFKLLLPCTQKAGWWSTHQDQIMKKGLILKKKHSNWE